MSVQRRWGGAALLALALGTAGCFGRDGEKQRGTAPPDAPPEAARTWTITASAGAGGTISPSGSVSVGAGGRQKFTFSPDAGGWTIADIVVDGVSRGAIDCYEFEDVGADHTIAVTFREPPKGPCSVVLKLATQGKLPDGVRIGGIRVPLTYAAHKGLSISAGDVVASGGAEGALLVANANAAGQVLLGLITAAGIPASEFATLTFKLTGGTAAGEGDFAVGGGVTVIDVDGAPIPAVSVVIASQASM